MCLIFGKSFCIFFSHQILLCYRITSPSEGSSTPEEVRSEAVKFLGQLRQHEDSLADWLKLLAKKDPRRLHEIFTAKVDGWTPLHACTLRGARKLVKVRKYFFCVCEIAYFSANSSYQRDMQPLIFT